MVEVEKAERQCLVDDNFPECRPNLVKIEVCAVTAKTNFDGNGDGNPAELWRHAMNHNERSTLKFSTQ